MVAGLKTQTSAARVLICNGLPRSPRGAPLPIGRVLSGIGRGAPFCPRPQGPKPSHLSHWQVFRPRLPRLTRGVALKSQISERPP
jgi:hypothetical protein